MVLIEIEGNDGSGKETQSKLLCEKLKEKGYKTMLISFPNYSSEISIPIKMYLNGELGKNPNDINPYAISTFFAIDRYAFFKEFNIKDDIDFIILDRYVGSNAIYQSNKIKNKKERGKFLEWLFDLEYNKFQLPKPNKIFFLNVNPKNTQKLRENRPNKINGSETQDIHESNTEYLYECYENGLNICQKYNWYNIQCDDKKGNLRSIQDINNQILNIIKEEFLI